ncbi:P-loop containing nucleoside triphosphate hydrolase protein [Mycena maculata]|uniref:RNA helicase n=1 Tax=Mycena maculata TaxID=230809 RepID=A0AAD7KFN3_9AGAR|nr:P-loop containing nucleoside triphosphate hydrolase protein [Mycena maculata]
MCSHWTTRRFPWGARPYSQSFEAHAASLDKNNHAKRQRTAGPRTNLKSFEALGLHPPIVSALRAAFPSIKHPTTSQEALIPAVLDGRDIFLQDQTGSGKSFGLVCALLNRPRAEKRRSKKPAITSIFIVPHRDLAYQFYHWVERMFTPAASVPSFSIGSIAQVLVRGSRGSGLPFLRENPPHLLFGTPQALMDVYREDPGALKLDTLSALVVDEADYLVPTWAHRTSRERKVLKQPHHPGDTREFLDIVYGKHGPRSFNEDDELERDRSPQLIVSSATLPAHLVEYVSEESGWLDRDDWITISPHQSESKVAHSVLVVSEDHVRNIDGAVPPRHVDVFPTSNTQEECDDPVPENDPALVEKYSQTPSPFNPLALETIAMLFATDVPSIALLVIPSTSPVQRAIYELREVGVNAHGLDLLKEQPSGRGALLALRANPTLLVSTWANTRGLDVRELSHVFMLGVPDHTGYIHIAGRVGRLESHDKRLKGKAVMVVDPGEEDAARDLLRSIDCVPAAVGLDFL